MIDTPILINMYDCTTIVSVVDDINHGEIIEFQNVPYSAVQDVMFIIPEEQLILEIKDLTCKLK